VKLQTSVVRIQLYREYITLVGTVCTATTTQCDEISVPDVESFLGLWFHGRCTILVVFSIISS
jgi:hypothetical protein